MKEHEKRGESLIPQTETRYAPEKMLLHCAVLPACQMLREVTSVSKNTLFDSYDSNLLGTQLRLN